MKEKVNGMNAYLALSVCVLFILWLYARDLKLRPMTSIALWIPLLWIMIIGSRTTSYWSSLEVDPYEIYTSSLEGSPLDRNIFLILIICGTFALWRRRLNWGKIFASNPWLFAFFLYCGVSVIWSDYPFASFKKWTKDLGNVIMILIILTESNPVMAIKSVFARYIYFAIPLSALLIMYFPELGSYTTHPADMIAYCGVTTNKNELGTILAISGLFLVWDLIDRRVAGNSKTDMAVRSVLLAMVVWLLIMAKSATALVCMTIGITILLCMRVPFVKKQVRHLGVYSLVVGFLIIFLFSYPPIIEMFVQLVGRDVTFTGRTDIWAGLLQEPVNLLLGTGFQSFWIRPGLMEKYDFINEAHNGYLETYLNGGLVGVCLLMAMIVSIWSKLKEGLLHGNSQTPLLFSFFVVTICYNLTEAVFNRLSLTWFIFLIAALSYPRLATTVPENIPKRALASNPKAGRGKDFAPVVSN